jgi:pimeloyl-ACP methyl ester carboxylesterase
LQLPFVIYLLKKAAQVSDWDPMLHSTRNAKPADWPMPFLKAVRYGAMPTVSVRGIELCYESTGSGIPIVFCHEFAGDLRSWAPQVNYFSRRYHCVAYSQRGYKPSSIPEDPAAYSQDHLVDDLLALVEELGLDRPFLVGFSMGGNVVLNLAFRRPDLCRGIVVAGCGAGSGEGEKFRAEIEQVVDFIRTRPMDVFAEMYASSASRLPFKRKDPRGWVEFRNLLADHSPAGLALTMRGVQGTRPSIFALADQLKGLRLPTLVIIGDEDEGCVDPAVFMKRNIPTAGLAVLPQTGHTLNLEEPAAFNQVLVDFFDQVEAGAWAVRSTVSSSLLPEK